MTNSSTRHKLEQICNGYPLEEFSLGRKFMAVFFSDLFGVEFDESDVKSLRNRFVGHTLKDARAAYQIMRKTLNSMQKTSLPTSFEEMLADHKVERFSNEGDYLAYLASKVSKSDLDELNQYTRDNILAVRDGKSILLKAAYERKVDMYSFDPKSFGGVGFMVSGRRKPLSPALRKGFSRSSEIFVTESDILVEAMSMFNDEACELFIEKYEFHPLEDIQSAYTLLAYDRIKDLLSSGVDVQTYFEDKGRWKGLESLRKVLKRLAFTDVGGFSFSGSYDESMKFKDAVLGVNKGRVIDDIEDNLTEMVKDSSVVIPVRGSKPGEYVEARIGPWENILYGAFGFKDEHSYILGHPLYKRNEDQKVYSNIGFSPDFRWRTEECVMNLGYKTVNDVFNE